MNTKELTIEPVGTGGFQFVFPGIGAWICADANEVGAKMEGATWPIIKPALESRKKIKITFEYEAD